MDTELTVKIGVGECEGECEILLSVQNANEAVKTFNGCLTCFHLTCFHLALALSVCLKSCIRGRYESHSECCKGPAGA